MKRFDKGYIFCALLSDLFYSLGVLLVFFSDLFIEEDARAEDVVAAIPALAAVFVIIYLCFIAYRVMYHRTSGYELTETEIKCKRGVFFRKRSVLEYKKIHAINKKQSILQRIFGIATLTVDSGSANTAHQAEITILEKDKTAESLMCRLNALKAGGEQITEDIPEDVLLSDNDSLYSFTSRRKMLYTLISILSTAFFTAALGVLAIIAVGACKLVLRLDSLGTWGQYFLFAVLITAGFMLLFSAISFIGCMINSFVKYHKFSITRRENTIRISFGLLERHTNTFSYDRIKAVKISQGLIQRILGFASIKLEVIGYTSDDENESTELGVIVPFCKYDEVGEILARVLPDYIPDKKQTGAVAYFPFVSWFLLILGAVTAVALSLALGVMLVLKATPFVIHTVILSVLIAAFAIALIKSVSAALAYKTCGLAISCGRVTAYSGGFIRTVTVFIAKRLVAVENVTTPMRRKKGIASLVMHLKTNEATNEVKVHIQRAALAEELEKLLVL